MSEMTKETIVASCKANGGYAAPLLNDQLFLHCKGFVEIANLEPYTNTKVLWLEQNALSNLRGLDQQQELISLFVQNNMLRSLKGLTTPLRNLRVLNISNNYLTSLKGLGVACPMLETLQASHNRIASLEACEDLLLLSTTLGSVDLSFNRIATAKALEGEDEGDDTTAVPISEAQQQQQSSSSALPGRAPGSHGIDDDVRVVELAEDGELPPLPSVKNDPMVLVDFFKQLPEVSVIYMHGNTISHGLKHYRRNMVLHLPQLTYLDERPVFPEERRVIEAWGHGGEDAESAERAAIREERKKHLNSCVRVLTEKMESNRELRDKLTRQWEAKRAEELEQLNQLRRQHRDARAAFESREAAQREVVETEEQSTRWDVEEDFAAAHASLQQTEAKHLHEYEQAKAVEAATAEAAREIAAEEKAAAASAGQGSRGDDDALETGFGRAGLAVPTTKEALMAELLKSDDDILREMEEELESVLGSLGPSTASPLVVGASTGHDSADKGTSAAPAEPSGTDFLPFDRAAAKAGRALHAAVGQVATKLREDRAADRVTQADLWSRLDQWEKRGGPSF